MFVDIIVSNCHPAQRLSIPPKLSMARLPLGRQVPTQRFQVA